MGAVRDPCPSRGGNPVGSADLHRLADGFRAGRFAGMNPLGQAIPYSFDGLRTSRPMIVPWQVVWPEGVGQQPTQRQYA